MLAREERGAIGRADRCVGDRVDAVGGLTCEAVHIRSAGERVARESAGVVAELVGEEEDEVGLWLWHGIGRRAEDHQVSVVSSKESTWLRLGFDVPVRSTETRQDVGSELGKCSPLKTLKALEMDVDDRCRSALHGPGSFPDRPSGRRVSRVRDSQVSCCDGIDSSG